MSFSKPKRINVFKGMPAPGPARDKWATDKKAAAVKAKAAPKPSMPQNSTVAFTGKHSAPAPAVAPKSPTPAEQAEAKLIAKYKALPPGQQRQDFRWSHPQLFKK